MGQVIAAILFFSISLGGFWSALKFSKINGESHRECTGDADCELKKLGLRREYCNNRQLN